jgi:hypothetical protein
MACVKGYSEILLATFWLKTAIFQGFLKSHGEVRLDARRGRVQDRILREHDGTGAAGASGTPKASFISAQGNALGFAARNNSER